VFDASTGIEIEKKESKRNKNKLYVILYMDYRRTAASSNTETRDVMKLAEPVGNVYEMVVIVSKRANQIGLQMKQDLDGKLQEFASYSDNLEEVFENHEQIEISRFYEKLPKPSLLAVQEWKENGIYYRSPEKDKENF
jgi:DNA-directed RNA polymerase subunit K/omega